jgi:hypothetical protein
MSGEFPYNIVIPDIINEYQGEAADGITREELWKNLSNQSKIAAKPDLATMNLKIKKLIEQNILQAKGPKVLLTSAFMKKWVKKLEKG